MDDSARRDIAYTAGICISGLRSNAIFDCAASRYTSINGEIDSIKISIYDYERQCFIAGIRNNNVLSLYDYGKDNHITMNIEENSFNGFDHASSSHFHGSVAKNSITLFDHQISKYFNYAI